MPQPHVRGLSRALLAIALSACRPAESLSTPTPTPTPTPRPTEAVGFDGALAKRLGADEYGMRPYVIAFLRTGANRGDPQQAADLLRAHLDNIQRLAAEGKLVVAGPFMDNGELRGIYIFDVQSVDEARDLTETDPAVQAGHFVMELRPWYGSAALKEVNAIHQRLAQKNP